MYCASCGARIQEGQNYCNGCGKPASTMMVALEQRGKVDRHIRLLGILWLAISVLRLIPGITLLIFGGFAVPFVPFHVRAFVLPFAAFLGAFFLASAIVGLAAGWGLLEHRSWARPLALIIGVIALIHVPLGTALGIYTLWVLLPSESEQEYRRLSQAA